MASSRFRHGPARTIAAGLLLGGAVLLSGCSSMIADHLPVAAGGLPEDVPQRSATPAVYPAVHDVPPPRSQVTLTEAERKQLEADLVAARSRADSGDDGTASTAKP